MIIQRFNLNLIPNQSPVIVHVNQYDTGTGRLIATLYEGNEPYSPNGTAVIQGTKPDGHGFQYTATLDGNVVTADLTEQMSPVAGDVRVQIVVTESSGVTGTFVFIMRVQPSALPSDADMSESDYPLIEEAIREAQEAVQRAEEAITETQENAEDSEAWAQGTRGGIPVEPTDPTYEHNAEYWAQYAERYAQGGLHYKASIPFANIPTTGMREGDMYDITDDFTTDSRFTEGAGIKVKGGTNIAWNSDNKWDILALPYIPKTTFNGRSGSILPMAGDYDSEKILLSSILHIGGETQSDVQEALEALSNDGVKSFNGRSGSVLPMAGDYDSEKILLASVLHIGGETQENVQKALEALENNKADKVDNATADNFAGLDANGNLKDSGKNAGDFATPSDIAGQQRLVKDTVGWTGKNLLNITTVSGSSNGITWVVNSDKSISVYGTATGRVDIALLTLSRIKSDFLPLVGETLIVNGCPQGGAAATGYWLSVQGLETDGIGANDSGNGATFTVHDFSDYATVGMRISVASGVNMGTQSNPKVFYPMIRRADITDPTYEPYHESVEVMYEEEIHGVNLLKVTASTQTINGVTFTVNRDSKGGLVSIVANGTPTSGNAWLQVRSKFLLVGNYILSGCPTGGSSSKYSILFRRDPLNQGVQYHDYGNGVNIIAVEGEEYICSVGVYYGYTANNIVFRPMLRKADIEDSTYRPYNPQAIQNQLNAQGVLGAKNLLPNNATSQTINGVTFTVNADKSVTVNGTATANAIFSIISKSMAGSDDVYQKISGKNVIFTSNCKGSSPRAYMSYWDNVIGNLYDYDGNGFDMNLSSTIPSNWNISIVVLNNTTVNNLTFYPMIRLASDPDDTYQPYAMTNRELTEEVTGKSSPKILATANANQTYSSQLSILYAEYQKYSNSQKRKMFIGENGYSDMIYNIASINGTTFSTGHHINPQGIIVDECIRLSTNKIYRLKYNDGVITQTDMSSNTHSSSLVLYIG